MGAGPKREDKSIEEQLEKEVVDLATHVAATNDPKANAHRLGKRLEDEVEGIGRCAQRHLEGR